MAYSEGRGGGGGPNGGNFREDRRGGGWLCQVFFPGASYYSSVVAHPLIISVKKAFSGQN